MEVFAAQFEKIKKQFDALSATQKMLAASLVVVMLMTMLYWGKFAGTPDMVPVMNLTLAEGDIGPIVTHLESVGISSTVVGGKVMVPADRQAEAMGSLSFAEVLPQDLHSAFEDAIGKMNPLGSAADKDQILNHAKATELAQIIQHYPGVAHAQVVINAKSEARVEGGSEPSASVTIRTKGRADLDKLVHAAAEHVAHSVSRLTVDNVSVVIDGTPMRATADQTVSATQGAKLKAEAEREAELKLHKLFFGRIPGIAVVVNCAVNITTEKVKSVQYINPVTGTVETTDKTDDTTGTTTAPRGDPGFGANAGSNGTASIDGQSGSVNNNSSNGTLNTTKSENKFGYNDTDKNTPAGQSSIVSAAISVPHSYFANAYKVVHPKDKEPTEDALAAFAKDEISKIRRDAMAVMGLKVDDMVAVDDFADFSTEAVEPVAAASTTAITGLTSHAKEIGISVLATVALFMIASFVRKGSAAVAFGPSLAGGGAVPSMAVAVGGVPKDPRIMSGTGPLDAMELDDDAVHTQQMLEQVSTMVKENPDGAAALVKKWLSRP